MANLASGLFHGIPVSTSLSASSLNDSFRCPDASLARDWRVVVLTLIALRAALLRPAQGGLGAVIIDAVSWA